MQSLNIEESLNFLKQNTEHFIGESALVERLKAGKRLKVKFGVDPTRPDLTFGHLVVFNKLKAFQELGHEAILLIGDYTTLIGDPSGRSSTRPVLTKEEIKNNTTTYLEQAFKVLDPEKTTVRYNSEWFGKMRFEDCLGLARKMTIAQMLEREDFSTRYQLGTPVSIVEFLYPLLQGYDSVILEADVELGGTDQLFNLLVGRVLQKDAGQPEQIVMTSPLLVGLDGEKKMSKSLGNYIAFNDSSKDMFGKILSIPDAVMWDYYRLLLMESSENIENMKKEHPMLIKKQLAMRLVSKFFDTAIAESEKLAFEHVFSKKELPNDMPIFYWSQFAGDVLTYGLVDFLMITGQFTSKNDVRRLIEQGGVKLDQEKCDQMYMFLNLPSSEGMVIQAGKRFFCKILP